MLKMACPKFRSQSGLTLIELICVVAIIGLILLAGVLPGFHWGDKRKLEMAAWRLASDMRLARQSAISVGVTSYIQFRIFNDDYKISFPDEKDTVKLPEGISYGYINFPMVDGYYLLEFKSTGAPNRGGTVGLKCKQGKKLYIIVTPATGRVRVSPEPPPE
ncbi:MAG TPA: prepilin-type N-terminal cleavage/methylation domain-containing protein [Firmicutes bacterium]|nr:prepilin-type N-terminal cleavage/methylation domain-containing protein [Bacillota bacterium]